MAAVLRRRGVRREDRRDFGYLALMALVFGLVLAPILHRANHEHGHQHPGSTPTSHAGGSLEHQLLSVQRPAEPVSPSFFAIALVDPPRSRPSDPAIATAWPTEQPQGP